jgi:hypothetical protein
LHFLDNDPHFLDSHLCDLCFGIDSERLGEQSLEIGDASVYTDSIQPILRDQTRRRGIE